MVFEPFIYGFSLFVCLFFNPSLAKFLTMFILAQVNGVQKVPYYVIGVDKKTVMTVKI